MKLKTETKTEKNLKLKLNLEDLYQLTNSKYKKLKINHQNYSLSHSRNHQ